MRKYHLYISVFLLGSISTAIAATALKNFPDVPQNTFYTQAVQNMVTRGVIQGFDDGTFRPNDLTTRAQIVTMLDRYDKSLVNSDNDIGTLIDVICSTTKIGDSDGTLVSRFESLCSRRHQSRVLLGIDGDEAFFVNSSVLLTTQNENQNPAPANPENLMKEYLVFSYDPQKGTEKQLGTIKNNFFTDTFGYSNGKIFFINPFGELGSVNVNSQNEQTVSIPGIIPTKQYLNKDTLADFLIVGTKVFYLKGDCSEANYCALGVYDLSTSKNELLMDNLHQHVESTIFNVTRLMSYDAAKNLLKIQDSGGDAGSAAVTVYEFNVNTKKLTKIDSAEYNHYCDESNANCPSTEQQAENEKFHNIFESESYCNGVQVSESYDELGYDQVKVFGSSSKTFKETYYVGCIE